MDGIGSLRVLHVNLFGELETERILHEHTHERCDVSKDVVGDGERSPWQRSRCLAIRQLNARAEACCGHVKIGAGAAWNVRCAPRLAVWCCVSYSWPPRNARSPAILTHWPTKPKNTAHRA
jgi:hypothetical protein